MKNKKYIVMRLNTEVIATVNGHEIDVKMDECAGYALIFNTLKQAEKSAGGKYQVLRIIITK